MPSASTLFGASGNKIQSEPTQADGKTYEQLRQECLQRKKLFEDPDFPAKGSSLFYSQSVPVNFEWKRPGVCTEPDVQNLRAESGAVFIISASNSEKYFSEASTNGLDLVLSKYVYLFIFLID